MLSQHVLEIPLEAKVDALAAHSEHGLKEAVVLIWRQAQPAFSRTANTSPPALTS